MFEFVKKHREIIAYLIVGVLTTVVSWIVYALLRIVMDMNDPLQVQIAVFMRWFAGVLFAYFTNRKYVFVGLGQRGKRKGKSRKRSSSWRISF